MKTNSVKHSVHKAIIILVLAWSIFLAIAFLPGCSGQKYGCGATSGKNHKIGY